MTLSKERISEIVRDQLPDWEFEVDTFPSDEVFNPGGAQAYFMMGDLYAHGEGRDVAEAVACAAIRAISAMTAKQKAEAAE